MKKLFLCCVMCVSTALFAQAVLKNGDFEDGDAPWRLVQGAEISGGVGYNGTRGLHVWRDDPDQYSFPTQEVQLEPGSLYHLGLWVRGQGCNRATASFGVEYIGPERKWLGGAYGLAPQLSDFDWTYCEVTVMPPVGTDHCQVALYLEKGGTGNVWFDNVTLTPADRKPDIFLVHPLQGLVRTKGEKVRLKLAKLGGDRPDYFNGWTVVINTQLIDNEGFVNIDAAVAPVADREMALELGELPVGKILLNVALQNPAGEVVNLVSRTLQAVDEAEFSKAPIGACVIDELGRAFVDGKPFLPIGLYLSDLRDPDDLARLMGSPFNCFMPYNSYGLALPGEQKAPFTPEKIRALLDVVDRNGKKILFSVKDFFPTAKFQPYLAGARKNLLMPDADADAMVAHLVTSLKDHPAILAWYLNDEISLAHVQMVNDRRDLINRLDPWHPTWGVLCDYNEAAYFANACDVFGVDPYPLMRKADPRSQAKVVTAMDAFDASGLKACWCVPQLFNWATYQARRKPETYSDYVEPSEDEMRSMSLLMALRGARGFIFYSDFDLKRASDPNFFQMPVEPPQTFANRWHDICNVATLLQELAPFLLSDYTPQPVQHEILEGSADLRLFRDNAGNTCILVAAIGPGPVKVHFSPEVPNLRSRFGKSTPLPDGSWIFEGTDITCDVLEN